jgi:hypothetical protein
VQPSSYKGAVDVAVIMEDLAKQLGVTLENHGVSVMLDNPYFPGTAFEQMQQAAEAAHVGAHVDKDKGTLVLVPHGGTRTAPGSEIEISSRTGMVGYPTYTGPGQISLRNIYRPDVQFFDNVKVASVVQSSVGVWTVSRIVHTLESQMPNGEWFSDIQAWRGKPPE